MVVEAKEMETEGPPQEVAVLHCCLWVLSMRYMAIPLLYFLVRTEFCIWSHSNSRSIIFLVTQGSMSLGTPQEFLLLTLIQPQVMCDFGQLPFSLGSGSSVSSGGFGFQKETDHGSRYCPLRTCCCCFQKSIPFKGRGPNDDVAQHHSQAPRIHGRSSTVCA